jgi:Tfp pilus assembly PilM family ATPase
MKNFYLEKSLGIDIREKSICLTLLGKTLNQVNVLASKHIMIQPISKNDQKAESIFLEKVNRFIIEHDAWTENVIVSIPRSKITVQSFELPSPDRKSVDSMMGFELERHFSSSLDNFYFYNHITTKKQNQFHIVCAAVNKEVAADYLKLIKKLNLNASILDVSTFANLNLLLASGEHQDPLSVMVDISPDLIEILILINKNLEFSRTVPIKEPEFQEIFLNPENQSESHKRIAEQVAQILVEEIKNTLASCRNIDNSKSVDTIFISGGGHLISHLALRVERVSGVQVVKLKSPKSINQTVSSNPAKVFMATSLSLALRELKTSPIEANLLPENLTTTKQKKINIKNTVGLALATFFFVIAFMVNQNIQAKNTLISLNKQLEEIKTQMGPLEKVDLEYETLQKYTKALNKIDELNPTKLSLLVELSQIIPSDTWLKKIRLKKKSIELNGISKNASQLIPIVEKSSHFRNTHFVGTIITESTGEKFTINTAVGTKE